ncbi:ATP-binding protein [Nocardia sp. NPDC050697]|uniref:AlbA family DNA-binding domain-containing protein n=1 Tax=Nocardia sp. NPDC050697 TaxID=3155158 RepID=UPI0033F4208F
MTTPGPVWPPRTEEQLQFAADTGLLEETHHLDLKRQLGTKPADNKKFACDIAAFALDGGTIIIGVTEDTESPTLWPVELRQLPERVESIAATAVQEAVQVTTSVIFASDRPGYGYLVVAIPRSPRAPHMADGRFYGRGDKKNRVLSNEEVARLHRQRFSTEQDILAATRTAIDGLGERGGRNSILGILAEPLGAPDDLLVPLTESEQWQTDVHSWVQQAAASSHRNFAPDLADGSGFRRRAQGVALTVGMHNGQRWAGNGRAAELAFREDGSIFLASEKVVWTMTFDHVTPKPAPAEVLFEDLIIGQTELLMRVTAIVAQRFGFTGSWKLGLVATGLRGTVSYTRSALEHGPDGEPYSDRNYERATEVTLADLTTEPRRVVKTLVSPLLRSLGSFHHWSPKLTDASKPPGP